MQEYRNTDGTYTSPRNGKTYKSEKAFKAHWHYAGTTNPDSFANRLRPIDCVYCKRSVLNSVIGRHEKSCYLNPANTKYCELCKTPIKDYKNNKGTCSHSCSNRFFRELRNKPENYTQYATICYFHHEKRCVVCDESDAVDVHHLDCNKTNNSITNLIPLCPTHHAYCHRGLFSKIEEQINQYLKEFKNKLGLA